jgi:mono/diheme cytochrome c family protein
MRVALWWLAAAVLVAGDAAARPSLPVIGERFARRACAGCHAIGPTGRSPMRTAPPFRALPAGLSGAALSRELASISVHGHRDMPPIYMTPGERRAVAAYIRALAQRSERRRT